MNRLEENFSLYQTNFEKEVLKFETLMIRLQITRQGMIAHCGVYIQLWISRCLSRLLLIIHDAAKNCLSDLSLFPCLD